jgi:GNAT superfamily N-acetyltransferase
MHVDRGADYLALRRLMGDPIVLIADVDGEPAGTLGSVVHTVMIDGRVWRVAYRHHARVLPSFQRQGVGRALGARLGELEAEVDGSDAPESTYWWIDRTNVSSANFAVDMANRWSSGALWGAIDTATEAGQAALEDVGRVATSSDAVMLAAMFNAAHVGEQLFRPYSADRIRGRLTRDAATYGWSSMYLSDGAAVGVWPEWVSLETGPVEMAASEPVERERINVAAVLDYGCLPGHEDELVALLRGWCRTLSEREIQRLSIFTSPPARLHDVVRPMLQDAEELDLWTPGIEEPAASRYGVYVDHVYY